MRRPLNELYGAQCIVFFFLRCVTSGSSRNQQCWDSSSLRSRKRLRFGIIVSCVRCFSISYKYDISSPARQTYYSRYRPGIFDLQVRFWVWYSKFRLLILCTNYNISLSVLMDGEWNPNIDDAALSGLGKSVQRLYRHLSTRCVIPS